MFELLYFFDQDIESSESIALQQSKCRGRTNIFFFFFKKQIMMYMLGLLTRWSMFGNGE